MSASLFDSWGEDFIPKETEVKYYDGDKKFSELKTGDKVWFYDIGYKDEPYLIEITVTSEIRRRKDKEIGYYRLVIPCERYKEFPSALYKWEKTYLNIGSMDYNNGDFNEEELRNGSVVRNLDGYVYGTNKESVIKEIEDIIQSRILGKEQKIVKINKEINDLKEEHGKLQQIR